MNGIKYNKGVTTVSNLVEKYRKSGRLTEEMVKSVTDALEKQDLKLAVIGKMKAGKSSLTNALIFHDNVLPTGTEPTTVTLTEIVYTDDPSKDSRVKVELLTPKDITDLQTIANSESSQISQSAKDLLDSINRIPGGYEQYVSKGFVEIDLNELTKFTSVEGEFSGLAKKVTVYKHLDVLRGLKITDTPGFNDPVESRGEETKNALRDCHIILFVHDYLDKYEQDEIAILLEQVEYSGISMLVDIINRIDMHEDMTPSQWLSYIPKFDRKKEEAIKQIPKEGIKELLTKGRVSYVSALMALIGYEVLEYDRKKSNGIDCNISENTKEFYVKYQNDFSELKSADDFVKYSNINGIVDIINQLSADKSEYLANYPIQTLIGLLKSTGNIISEEKNSTEKKLDTLTQNAVEAQRELDAINDIFRALGNKINSPMLATKLRNCIDETKRKIQNLRNAKSTDEFTASKYEKKGVFLNYGPENRNLSNYKGVLMDFDNEVRNKLEELKDVFHKECGAYVNELIQGLVTNNTTLQDRNSLASALISLLESEISKGLNISVNQDEPKDILYGDGMQYSLYRSDFLRRRSDAVIDDNYLKIFRDFVDSTIDSDVLRDKFLEKIDELKAQLKRAIDYSPAEKTEETKKLRQKISELEIELKNVETDITSLEELKKA